MQVTYGNPNRPMSEQQLALIGEVENRWDDEFEQWWKAYPVKKDKQPAKQRFRTLRRRGVSPERLLRARDRYLAQATPGFIKHGKTFLGVWDEWDYPEPSERPPEPTLRVPEVSFCAGCGEMAQYCLCGKEMH